MINYNPEKNVPHWVKRAFPLLLLALMFLLLTGCQMWDLAHFQWQNANAKAEWQNKQRRAVVPFTMLNGHIVVNVSVNNSETMAFVLDSGAAATVITTTERTDTLGLPKNKPITINGSGEGENPTAYIVTDTKIQMGDFSMSGLAVVYAPTAAMPFATVEETYFDGVLGANFFNCCLLEINHDKQVLVFSAPNAENRAKYDKGNWQTLAIEVEENSPFITTKVQNGQQEKPVKLLLDTGSTGALSLFAGEGEFTLPTKTYASKTTGINGDTSDQIGALNKLILGAEQFAKLPTHFRVDGSTLPHESQGILGNRVIQQFNTVFDFSGETIRLQRNQTFDDALASDRSGLRVWPHPKGAIVKSISPETEAEALNIPINAILTQINGSKINNTNFDELKRLLSAQELDSVSLCWLEAQHEKCDLLPLKTRI